jgi:hypothetical protein
MAEKVIRATILSTRGPDLNGDIWPVEELPKIFRDFIGKEVFTSNDRAKKIGSIIDCHFDEKKGAIEILAKIDGPETIDGFISYRVQVMDAECSECHKHFNSEVDFCDHLKNKTANTICREIKVLGATLEHDRSPVHIQDKIEEVK